MARSGAALGIGTLLLTAACGGAGAEERPAVARPAASDWRASATREDRARIRDWRTAWTTALAAAGRKHGAEIAREGALLKPDAALNDPAPPPGDYRCRVTKLGAKSAGLLDYVAYPYFKCRVVREGPILSFAKLDGSQRPVGLLFPDGERRMVFLGAMMLADERRALDYGSDPERDMAGLFERIGPGRWRLVMPYPRWESLVDVFEVVK